MSKFIKGYDDDAGEDIVLSEGEILEIRPGFNTITLSAKYTPQKDEVAFLVSRGSTAAKGIFPLMVAIDTGYTGNITAWVINCSDSTHVFMPGERAFAIVNFKKAPDRGSPTIARPGEKRGENKTGSSGK